jgi:hypothetical protein
MVVDIKKLNDCSSVLIMQTNIHAHEPMYTCMSIYMNFRKQMLFHIFTQLRLEVVFIHISYNM